MSQIRGRFHKETDRLVTAYTTSIPFDWRLYRYDIAGSVAHAKMLARRYYRLTLVDIAKLNGVNPRARSANVLPHIAGHKLSKLDDPLSRCYALRITSRLTCKIAITDGLGVTQ